MSHPLHRSGVFPKDYIAQDANVLKQVEAELSEDVDPNKLMVEIVQGLLMAHERLDRMESALRQAVGTASRAHLNSFDKQLRDVDVRFQQTTVDAGKAVKSLQEVRADFIQSVQGSAEHHLDAFTQQLSEVDARFQQTAKEVVHTIHALEGVRDSLVKSVQAANEKHNKTFSDQVTVPHD